MTAPALTRDEWRHLARLRAMLAARALDAATAGCIADCGQPRFPYWRLLVAALLALNVAMVAQQALGQELDPMRRPRGNPRRGPVPTQLVRRAAGRGGPFPRNTRTAKEVAAC
ncbi:hypothetical protein [Ferruginivarius sediminum]|uniref:Uncharacterized protein n=1 Tax=Ferruginivarius sediminum TaxID=2661937 RepID=A0A369T8G2_9PROT|nr:hypothetical protein [Ferruginivarius sediminum]RDD60467.1 hypothetical protein DRB17_17865 [Ferruginivarius sediminum]